jgi:hypothetical protein
VHVVAAVAEAMLYLTCSESSTVFVAVAEAKAEKAGLHDSRYRQTEAFGCIGNVGMERIIADGWIYPATAP